MTVEITDDATPTIVGKRIGAIGLQVVCPYCRQTMGWKRGSPNITPTARAASRGRGTALRTALTPICRSICSNGNAAGNGYLTRSSS